MANYITIDGGTTNTRLYLVCDYKIIDSIKLNIGAKKCAEGNTLLKNEIKKSINILLNKYDIKEEDITRILASGMITSEFGLCNLEHITTPAGIEELHNSMHEVMINDISSFIPFVFIRGVKYDKENVLETDVMRGEETELFGIIEDFDSLYILPGSHSKIISTDENGKITYFKTMLTGEMIGALAENTILKSAIDLSCEEIDSDFLKQGFSYCYTNGINDSLFKTRILSSFSHASKTEIYSYFLGVILCDEIKYILKKYAKNIYIGGRKQIKEALFILLKYLTKNNVIMLTDDVVDSSCVKGIIKIFEYNH